PPQPPHAHFVAAPLDFRLLLGEDLFHLPAIVAAKFRGGKSQKHSKAAGCLFGLVVDHDHLATRTFVIRPSESSSRDDANAPALRLSLVVRLPNSTHRDLLRS